MENSITYTIIIPHYNLPNLLCRCLKSIPKREDIQVIVVDDMSCEKNRFKLKEVQQNFPHIQFIFSEKNGGGGAARNRGLEEAKGEFILFADADDYFQEGFDKILDKYAMHENDIVFFNANFINADSGEVARQPNHVTELIDIHKENPCQGEKLLRYYFGEPWCKMVRRNVIQNNNIRFEETNVHNDAQYSYLVGFYAKKIAVCADSIYNYTIRENSVSRINSDDRILVRVRVFAKKNQFLRDNDIDFFDKMLIWPFRYCKKQNKHDLYKKCVNEAEKYGFDEKFINRMIRQHRIKKICHTFKHVISKIFGIKESQRNPMYS
ncbi:MAG: glycosyltransferase [Fibrobacter sp.]|nr:glycosyltransferase [Fibrobacter sp.]